MYRYATDPVHDRRDDRDLDATYALVEVPYARVFRSDGEEAPDAYYAAARHFELGRIDSAEAAYLRAIAAADTELMLTRGDYELGIVYWRHGRPNAARERLTSARLGAVEYYEDATWALARLAGELGDVEEARQLYRDLVRLGNGPYVEPSRQMLDRLADPLD